MSDEKQYLSKGDKTPSPGDVLEWARKSDTELVDLKFIDFPGSWQHTTIPAQRLERGALRGRDRVRRLVDPRLARDQRDRHADRSRRPRRRSVDPFTEQPTLSLICAVIDPITAALRRPAPHRQEGRGVPSRRPASPTRRLHRPRGRVLRLRRRALRHVRRTTPTTRSTAPRARGTPAARSPEPRLQDPAQGGILPRPADDTLADLRSEMMMTLERARHRGRGRPPRGRERRAVRDRHEVRAADSAWPTS